MIKCPICQNELTQGSTDKGMIAFFCHSKTYTYILYFKNGKFDLMTISVKNKNELSDKNKTIRGTVRE